MEVSLPIAEFLMDSRMGSLFLSIVMKLTSAFLFFLSYILVLSFITMVLDDVDDELLSLRMVGMS